MRRLVYLFPATARSGSPQTDYSANANAGGRRHRIGVRSPTGPWWWVVFRPFDPNRDLGRRGARCLVAQHTRLDRALGSPKESVDVSVRSESSAYEACWYPTQGLGGEDTRSDEEHQSPPSPFFWRAQGITLFTGASVGRRPTTPNTITNCKIEHLYATSKFFIFKSEWFDAVAFGWECRAVSYSGVENTHNPKYWILYFVDYFCVFASVLDTV